MRCKKIGKKSFILFFLFWILFVVTIIIQAEENVIAINNYDFENNEDKYMTLCYTDGYYDSDECVAFYDYLNEKNSLLEEELEELEAEYDYISENILKYVTLIQEYQDEIDSIDNQIEILEDSVSLQTEELGDITDDIIEEMETYEEQISFSQSILTSLSSIFKENKLFSFLSTDEKYYYTKYQDNYFALFSDSLLTLTEIENSIYDFDEKKSLYLSDVEEVQKQTQLLSDSKSLAAQLKEQMNIILILFKQQEAEIVAQMTSKIEDIDEVLTQLRSNRLEIAAIVASSSFATVVSGDYYISASVWAYPESFGGGLHLGTDVAAAIGTELYAPSNGVILFSANACSEPGYYGDMCGSPGAAGGGNQTYFLTEVDGDLYIILFAHLNYGSVLETGTIVEQGDVIGEIGDSGNVTGAHTHVEMFYLGDSQTMNEFIDSWDGDLSFGALWGTAALEHICNDSMSNSVCRVNSENFLNY